MTKSKRRLVGLAILVLVTSAVLLLLLSTTALRLILNQVPGLELGEGLSGRVLGPIAADRMRWSKDGLLIEIEGLQLDHAPSRLFGGRAAVSGIDVRRLRVSLPPPATEAEAEPDNEPIRLDLPAIELPFDISAAAVHIEQIEVFDHAGESLFDADMVVESMSLLAGVLDIQGLQINDRKRGRLQLDGRLDSNQDWAGELRLGAELGEPLNSRLSLHTSGNLRELAVQLSSEGGVVADLKAQISDLRQTPRWDLQLDAEVTAEAELPSLPPGELRVQLQAQGGVDQLSLRGDVAVAGYHMKLQPLQAQLRDHSIDISGSAVDVVGQVSALLHADGRWPLRSDAQPGDLQLRWEQLLVAGGEPELRSARGEIALTGFADDYQFDLRAALARADLSGELTATGLGSSNALSDLNLALESSAGEFLATGEIQFEPLLVQLQSQARQLKPQILAADWPGLINLDVQLQLQREADQLNASVQVERLHGDLRGAAVSGQGSLAWVSEAWPTGELTLEWGGNKLAYQREAGDQGRLSIDARKLDLGAPNLQGRVQVDLRVPERLDDLAELTGTADAFELRLPGLEVDSLNAARSGGSTTPISIVSHGVRASNVNLQELELHATPGKASDWTLDLRASGPELALDLAAELAPTADGWKGLVRRLNAQLQPWPAFRLQQPAQWHWNDGKLRLERSCLMVDQAPAESGIACVEVESSAADQRNGEGQSAEGSGGSELQVRVELAQLSLTPLNRLGADFQVELEGLLEGQAEIRIPTQGGAQVSADLSIPQLLLSLPGPDDERLTRKLAVSIQARPEDGLQFAELTLNSDLGGALRASARGDLGADVPDWSFNLHAQDLDMRLLEGVSRELVSPRGTLLGDLSLRWHDQRWAPEGELQLAALSAELPSAGITFSELDLRLGAAADGLLSVAGTGLLGEGRFEIDGFYPLDPKAEARLTIKGTDLLLANLPIVRLEASPDLQLIRDGERIKITGEVIVPSAMIDLARFEPEVKASPDVVVIDDPLGDQTERLKITADLKVSIGENVKLKGFGLDGRLKGALSIRERPGKLTTGRGELDVTGSYRAYGQDLTIKRGKLLFSGGPVAIPGLDLLAVRKIEGVEAGVRVRGAADNPELALYSNPPMDQADVLSYLVLGRVLTAASGSDNQALGAAASALGSVGGSLLASKLGAGTGLEVSMETSADLGGAALTVGRFLNPKLYFGIGQSIFEPISVAILRFRLSDRWELEGLSGRELKAGVNFRHEK